MMLVVSTLVAMLIMMGCNYDGMWNFGNILNVESIGYIYRLDCKCERAFKDVSKVLELSKVEDGVVS